MASNWMPARISTPAITNIGPCWSITFWCGFMIFIPSSIADDNAARQDAQRAKAAEEVQRPAHVFQQEADRQQIEEDAEGAPDAVVALAALAVHVA